MKTINSILIFLSVSALVSCYGIKDENYPSLAQIAIVAQSDTINANIGEQLVWDGLLVESELLPLKYEWSYGLPKAGTQIKDHKFASISRISDSPTIDYTFHRTGSYILRLKVDNGQSIVFRYFTLNVNSGFDEGFVVLSNDASGKGSLCLIKSLDEVCPMNTFGDFSHGTALFMSDFTDSGLQDESGNNMLFTGLLVATNDVDGTIYHIEPKTMELNMKVKMSGFGTYCAEFGGEYSRVHSFTTYFRGADGRIFQYDMQTGSVSAIAEVAEPQDRIYPMLSKESPSVTRYPAFFNANSVSVRKSSSAGVKVQKMDGWEVVNMGVSRVSYSTGYVLWQNAVQRDKYRISSCYISSWNRPGDITVLQEFNNADLKMDRNSRMLPVKKSSDLYYNYGNAIYRWGLTSQPSLVPAITLPEGEQFRDMCTNFLGKITTDEGEDCIAVATWNPSKAKGSVFVYSVETQQMIARFEGICDEPAAIIYKYRLN
ncbi:MAG: hypothetical protein K6F21_03340 [Bacteroidales bacterium]|nr:hypothetical protein [Bacteroidales bacterium]